MPSLPASCDGRCPPRAARAKDWDSGKAFSGYSAHRRSVPLHRGQARQFEVSSLCSSRQGSVDPNSNQENLIYSRREPKVISAPCTGQVETPLENRFSPNIGAAGVTFPRYITQAIVRKERP